MPQTKKSTQISPRVPVHISNYFKRSSYGTSGLLIAICLIGIILFFVWASWAKLDIVSRAPATVIPSGRIQTIQSLDGGILEALMVKEGNVVEKGQLLLRFDRVKAESAYRETLSRFASVRATIIRTQAEISGVTPEFPKELNEFPDVVAAQKALYRNKLRVLQEEIAGLRRSHELASAELDLNEPMMATGEVSKVDVIRLRRQVNEIRSNIIQRNNKYLTEAQIEYSKAQDDFGVLREQLLGRKDILDRIEVRAPVRGVVKNVRFTTVGGVVRPAEEILQIVPIGDEMLLQLKIKPTDVAFLKPGLSALVKIDAYDYSIYGMLKGKLIYLSPDTLREESVRDEAKYYHGLVRTTASSLKGIASKEQAIIPGMTASVDIKTGEQTVLSYLLKPILKSTSESFYER